MTTLSSYLTVANDLGRWRSVAAKAPDVATATKYFSANIGKATSIDALLGDRRLFSYAMTAFGLGDRTNAVGLMRKVLEQGVTDPKALANTLNDPKILAFAKAFDFAGQGTAVPSSTLADNVTGRYVDQEMQTQQGQQSPGVALALYFQENAPKLTTIYGVLADKKLLEVVQTALGVSPDTSAQPVDTQARLLSSKLNIQDFTDPQKLGSFIARFSAMYDMNNATADAGASSANAILYGASLDGSGVVGVDVSLILRLQNARQS